MKLRFVIREFATGRIVERAASYEEGFNRCIELHRQSLDHSNGKSYYVSEAVAA